MKKQFLIFLLLNTFTATTQALLIIETVWGQEVMDHPLLEALVLSPTMQRLKKIDQSGPTAYIAVETSDGLFIEPHFSRFDHCLGVWALLKKANVSLAEQVTGLLHDASHTAFSHLADTLFNHDERSHQGSYQDSIHEWFLERMEIPTLTRTYGIELHHLNPDNPGYKALEQPLPDLCADRIQYLIHTGVIFNKLSQKEARVLVDDLSFADGHWFFHSTLCARQFAELSLDFTRNLYGSEYNHAFYEFFSAIIREAFAQKLFTSDEFHFGTDDVILEKIMTSDDPLIITMLERCKHLFDHFTAVPYGEGTYNFKPKCRGVNPLIIQENGSYVRLTEIDAEYKEQFEALKRWCAEGYGLVCEPVSCS